jgi:hypothetical protein
MPSSELPESTSSVFGDSTGLFLANPSGSQAGTLSMTAMRPIKPQAPHRRVV